MERILVVGDSLTDASRNKAVAKDLGYGYVSKMQEKAPNIEWFNRGYNGAKTVDLLFQLTEDLELLETADIIVLMIGVNDVWSSQGRGKSAWDEVLEEWRSQFQALLQLIGDEKANHCQVYVLYPFANFQEADEEDSELAKRMRDMRVGTQEILGNHFPTYIIVDLVKILYQDEASWKNNFQADGVHWTVEMHEAVADALLSLGYFIE